MATSPCRKYGKRFIYFICLLLEMPFIYYFDGTLFFQFLHRGDKGVSKHSYVHIPGEYPWAQQHVDSVGYAHDLCSGEVSTKHQFVLSYTLKGYRKNVEPIMRQSLNSDLYKGWRVRIYHKNDEVAQQLIEDYKHTHLEFCNVNTLQSKHPHLSNITKVRDEFWNLIPMLDRTVDITCFRDMQADLSEREEQPVRDWLASDRAIHTMRDSPKHHRGLGYGLWCFRNGKYRGTGEKLTGMVLKQAVGFKLMHGQKLVSDVIWPVLKHNAMQHDSYKCDNFKGSLPFPEKRKVIYSYVGCLDHGCKSAKGQAVRKCPPLCRPKKYKNEWTFC